jgi:uncharacterized membrane protein YphA (DoxX/SURF4 family)
MIAEAALMLGATLARTALGAVLLFAAVLKLRNGQGRFLRAILGYELVPGWATDILARWLPWVELTTGAMLVVGLLSPLAAVMAFGLLLTFTLAIVHALLAGMNNDCGCTGAPTPVQWRLVARNLGLMALAILVYAANGGALSLDGMVSGPTPTTMRLDMFTASLVPVWISFSVAVLLLRRHSRTRARSSAEPDSG